MTTEIEQDPFEGKKEQEEQIVPKQKTKKKIRFIGKIFIYLLVFFIFLIISFSVGIISSGENLSKVFGDVGIWGQIKLLVGSDDKKLQGEAEDRINVLLLGIGGVKHDGPFLTDTIIIVSFKPSTNQVALISIPRDLLVQIPGYGWWKINHANSFGEQKNPGKGGELTKAVISQSFDIPIHYYIRVDFEGFKKIIDDLGGIDIEVENTLNDPMYPVPGKEMATTTQRYENLYIKAGKTHMDGDLALKYVRSRHALGAEGSDFARSKRQQKVLMAVKNKGLSFSTLINPYKVSQAMDTLSQNIATNVEIWEMIRFFNMGKDLEETDITNKVFTDEKEGPLYSSIADNGAYVLLPKAGDFSEMQAAIKNVFSGQKEIAQEKPKRIQIQNGTRINGLALRTSEILKKSGYQIVEIGNAPTQDYQKTVIYNLKEENNNTAINAIAELLGAEVAPAIPEWTKTNPSISSQADILIILGQDQKST